MSWVEKELRKREKVETRRPAVGPPATTSAGADDAGAAKAAELWARLEQGNDGLPAELRLSRQTAQDHHFPPDRMMFLVMLLAGNDSGIGFTGDALRYFWPEQDAVKSNNFWIRWKPGAGYRIIRRRKPSLLADSIDEKAFREDAVEYLLKCLVTGKQAKFRALSKRRFWIF